MPGPPDEPTVAAGSRPGAPAAVGRRRRLVRGLAGAAAVAMLAVAVVQGWAEVRAALRGLSAGPVLAAGVLVLGGLAANALSWRAVLAGLGSRLPVVDAGRVYLLAQLGKYVPGSLWPVLAQAELGRDHGVPRVRSAVGALAALVVGLVVGVVVAAVALALVAAGAARSYAWALLAVPIGVALLAPPVLERLLGLALRLARRDAGPQRVQGRALAVAAAWSGLMWLCFGAHALVLAEAMGAGPTSGVRLALLCTGAYALAWVAGFLVVVAPAGAGAREAALVLLLEPVLSRGEALALALVSRGLMLVGDVVAVLLALLAHAALRRRER